MQKQYIFIPGPVGSLEAVVQTPETPVNRVAVVCHPNPLQEGTMENKVITTLVRTFNALGMAAIRFNYRGVGKSTGEYGDVAGEVADCMAVINWAQSQWPTAKLWLAGFSFGAYIAAEAATKVPTEQLISIAPSVDRMPYADLPKVACPWLVIMGEEDEVVVPESVYQWFAKLDANKTLIKFPTTGHFFHGKLVDLQQAIEKYGLTNKT